MRIKITLIFILSVLIPTGFLSYFGLMAVRSEKAVVENNISRRYVAIADVIEGEIKSALRAIPQNFVQDDVILGSLLIKQASMFKGEAGIMDKNGQILSDGSKEVQGKVVFTRALKEVPYKIAIYERYPQIIERLEAKKKWAHFYFMIIGFSAFAITGAGAFASLALYRQWRLAELKSEFVSHLSHDLRGPLTSIRMFSEMLKDDAVRSEDKKREYYSIIASESERLTHLANNILDFSRIETGKKKIELKEDDVVRIVTQAIERFRLYMTDEERDISLKIDEGIPRLKMDADSMSQAMMNLLSNAAKYSPPGTPIKVSVLKNDHSVFIEIADKGVGIPAKELKKIFHKFYRVTRSESEVEGAGLGLALVKFITKVHRGRVMVCSEVGKGSKFTIELPMG